MWPKALAQLIELAPHITRLIPLADRFLSSRGAGDEAAQAQLTQLSAEIRSTLDTTVAQVTQANAGIHRQLNEQGERLAQLNTELSTTRAALEEKADALDRRMKQMERSARLQAIFTIIAAVLLIVILVVILVRVR